MGRPKIFIPFETKSLQEKNVLIVVVETLDQKFRITQTTAMPQSMTAGMASGTTGALNVRINARDQETRLGRKNIGDGDRHSKRSNQQAVAYN